MSVWCTGNLNCSELKTITITIKMIKDICKVTKQSFIQRYEIVSYCYNACGKSWGKWPKSRAQGATLNKEGCN